MERGGPGGLQVITGVALAMGVQWQPPLLVPPPVQLKFPKVIKSDSRQLEWVTGLQTFSKDRALLLRDGFPHPPCWVTGPIALQAARPGEQWRCR